MLTVIENIFSYISEKILDDLSTKELLFLILVVILLIMVVGLLRKFKKFNRLILTANPKKFTYKNRLLWHADYSSNPDHDMPLCPNCFAKDIVIIPMQPSSDKDWKCHSCNLHYRGNPFIQTPYKHSEN